MSAREPETVIASEAKQSTARKKVKLDCFVASLLAMTNREDNPCSRLVRFAQGTERAERAAREQFRQISAGLNRQNHHFLLLFGLWPAGVLPEANGLTGAAPPFFRFLSAFGFFFSLLLRI